jgi:hypothetical protein
MVNFCINKNVRSALYKLGMPESGFAWGVVACAAVLLLELASRGNSQLRRESKHNRVRRKLGYGWMNIGNYNFGANFSDASAYCEPLYTSEGKRGITHLCANLNLLAHMCEHEPSSHLEKSADLGAFREGEHGMRPEESGGLHIRRKSRSHTPGGNRGSRRFP